MATNSNSNSNNSFGGGFTLAGLQSQLAKRTTTTISNMKAAEPLARLETIGAFGTVSTAVVDGSVDTDETTGEVTFDGVRTLTVSTDPRTINLPWSVKYCNPTAPRNAEGKNTQGKTLIANAWKSEAKVKAIFEALSLIKRNVLVSVSEAIIVQSGKIVINLASDHVNVMPVILGGTEKKPIIQRGACTIIIDGKKYRISNAPTIDFQEIQQTGGGWFEFETMGSKFRHIHNVTGNQEAVYEYLVQILSTGCDVYIKGLNKFETIKTPAGVAGIIRDPKFNGFFDVNTARAYFFAMWATKAINTLQAGTAEDAAAMYETTKKENAADFIAHNAQSGLVAGSIIQNKMGVVHTASELFDLTITIDSAWAVSKNGKNILSAFGKVVKTADDGTITMDLGKFEGTMHICAINGTTHELVGNRVISTLRISTETGIKGEGKAAILNAETAEGKQNLKALAILSGLDSFNFPVVWIVADYTKEEAK